jgi:hypothetical protein
VSTPHRFKQHLVRRYLVRLHMTIIVLATTAAGLLVSKILLEAGLTNMLVRYPLSVLGAYLAFLGLARLWSSCVLRRESERQRAGHAGSPDWLDVLDGATPGHSTMETFSGGDSGGAGASGSWVPDHFEFHVSGMDFDWGEVAGVAIVLIGSVLIALGAGIYVIYWAPDILPEVALNVLLASCMTATPKRAESTRWIYRLFGTTWVALAAFLVTNIGLAAALHHECPRATRLVDARVCVPPWQIHAQQSPR